MILGTMTRRLTPVALILALPCQLALAGCAVFGPRTPEKPAIPVDHIVAQY